MNHPAPGRRAIPSTGLRVPSSRRQVLKLHVVLSSRPAPAPAKVEQIDAAYVTVRPCFVIDENVEEDAHQENHGAQSETAEEKSCPVTATKTRFSRYGRYYSPLPVRSF